MVTRKLTPASLLSFDVVDETGREGMARRDKRRRLYRAVGGAQARPGASDGTLARGSASILPASTATATDAAGHSTHGAQA